MVDSRATFNKMTRKLLSECEFVDNYVDDMLGHTTNCEEHLTMLFKRIEAAKLTVKPSKCFVGFNNTGHMVGNGVVQMEEEKLI